MYYVSKIKTNWRMTGLYPAFFSLLIFGITSVIFGMGIGLKILGLLFLIFSVFQFLAVYRTNNLGYWVSAFYLLIMGLYLNTVFFRGKIILPQEAKLLFVIVVFFLVWLVFLMITKRGKWRGREIMELAALEIEDGEDSYTDRPRPVKKIEYTKDLLANFSEYLKRNLVALPFFEKERVIFVPIKMGDEFPFVYGANINYWEKSWVAFDYDGNVSAHISKEDYLEYKDNLSFDPLCASLGEMFIEFMEYYKKDEEVRIIDKLNQIKTGFFS